jgi:tRNA-dihydrouridine synthase B
MIGRSAQGRPWLFNIIGRYLATGVIPPEPTLAEQRRILLTHLHRLYEFYGEQTGVRVARKHIAWYSKDRPGSEALHQTVNQAVTATEQLQRVAALLDAVEEQTSLAA